MRLQGSREAAASLNCTVNTDCVCQPAENKINCACTDTPITDVFDNEIQNRFPVRRPWITFKPSEHDPTTATAHVPTFTTAEFIILTKGRFNKVVTDVTNSVCRVNNAIAKGCYQCSQGAESKVVCTSDGHHTMASIRCDDTYFTVPCSPEGVESTLRFMHTLARLRKICDVNCGPTTTTFEITGILQ
uniref:Phlebovirus_G2 domain-containing protein n=1 Tax=Haemonchus contortus TaxID=6289 RepID=A0A7I4Y1F9_HAECO